MALFSSANTIQTVLLLRPSSASTRYEATLNGRSIKPSVLRNSVHEGFRCYTVYSCRRFNLGTYPLEIDAIQYEWLYEIAFYFNEITLVKNENQLKAHCV